MRLIIQNTDALYLTFDMSNHLECFLDKIQVWDCRKFAISKLYEYFKEKKFKQIVNFRYFMKSNPKQRLCVVKKKLNSFA